MTIYTKGIKVTTVDAGVEMFSLTSTEEEKKKALRIVYCLAETYEAVMNVHLEREKIAENIPIELLAITAPERVIEIDVEIPVGETLTGTLTPETATEQQVFHGFLEYEILA